MITDTTATALTPARRPPQPPSLDNTAKLLGTTADDLRTQLQSGKTLDDLASAKGISSSDLISAVKSDLQANKPAGAPDLSDDQLTKMATDVAAGKAPGRAHGHHNDHGAGGAQAPATDGDSSTASARLSSLADTLGVNPSDLLDALASGAKLQTGAYSDPSTQVDGDREADVRHVYAFADGLVTRMDVEA